MIRRPNVLHVLAVMLSAVVMPATVHAHGGEDHGSSAPPAPAIVERSGFAAEGSAFQVVIYPAQGKSVLFLADVDDNAPVSDATIAVEAPGWTGEAVPTREIGVYELAWVVPQTDSDVSLVVSAGGKDDLLLLQTRGGREVAVAQAVSETPPSDWRLIGGVGGAGLVALGSLVVLRRRRKVLAVVLVAGLTGLADYAYAHGGEDHGAGPAAQPPAAPGTPVTMSKPTQFLLGIRTTTVQPRQAADSVRVVGRVIPDPAGYARMQASQQARVVADPDHPLPVPGQMVKRGQVLAVLEPTLSTLEKGDKRATLSRVDGEIAITERDLAREESLGGLVPAKQVETTRIRLQQLRRERGQITGTALGRELLVAPVDGVVADVHVVPGEVVSAERALVEIVDPARLRVEAVIHDLGLATRISGAEAASNLAPGQSFPLTLLGVSPKIDPVDQGVHAIFQVAGAEAQSLRIGMPVDVFLATGAVSLRTAVPRDAIAEAAGRQVVFVRTAPETFEIRPVKVARVVGPLAEIAEGVAPGDRVVVQGIEQLKAGR